MNLFRLFGLFLFQQWVSSCLTASSWKERVSIFWEKDVFFPLDLILGLVPTRGRTVLFRSRFGFDWFDWELLSCCTTCHSSRWATSEPNSLFQSCFKEIFRGGRGKANTFSYITSECIKQEVFREEWSIESDGTSIHSSEQGWCRPNILRLDVSSKFYACIAHDAVRTSRSCRDPYVFFHGIYRQNIFCLLFKFWFPGVNRVLNDLEEVGGTELFLKNRVLVNQYNTDIFSCSSSYHGFLPLVVRPMKTMLEMFLESVFDSPEFNCSILSFAFLHVEGDEYMSSTPLNQRMNILLVQHRSKFFSQWGWFLWKSRQILVLTAVRLRD